MHRERGQRHAPKALPLLSQESDDLLLLGLRGQRGGMRAAELRHAPIIPTAIRHELHERWSRAWLVLGDGRELGCLRRLRHACLEQGPLVDFGVQPGDPGLEDVERFRQGRDLVGACLGSLVPVLRPVLAHLGQVLQVQLVVLEQRFRADEIAPGRRDVDAERLDVALKEVHRLAVEPDLLLQVADRVLEVGLCLPPLSFELILLGTEILQEAGQRVDDALRLVLVRGIGGVDLRLQHLGRRFALGVRDHAKRSGRSQHALHDLANAHEADGLRRLHGADGVVEGRNGLGQVGGGGLVLGPRLLEPRLSLGQLLVPCLGVLLALLQLGLLVLLQGRLLLNGRGQRVDGVPAGGDGG
mmetsp:Transcript_60983/g.176522  ORF Transcript_60983/g.176522 Transcript_60983/m.176522 type:complete len:356 (+) Transcript_60983:956-2023(+)